MKRIMVSLVIVILTLPCASSAEDWEHNNSPIRNFSFEEYSEETGFGGWEYGNELTMHPEDFGQDLAYSLHYSASAYIKEEDIGLGHESCYLQKGILASEANARFNGKPCYLVAFIKCKNVESINGGGAFAEIYFPPGDIVITYTSQMLTGDHNWCKLIVPFPFPPYEGRFDVRVGLRDATGEVWMDYVQIVQMDTMPEGGVLTDLENPSFDRDPYALYDWVSHTGENETIEEDDDNSMNGPNSAKFYFMGVLPPSNRTSHLHQDINTTSGPYTYCASAFVKTESLQYEQSPLHPGAKIHVLYEDKLDWYSRSVTGTNTWIKIQGIFDKPRGTSDTLELRLETLASSGTAWFDWVALKLNPIQNPHFNDWSPNEEPNLVTWWPDQLSGYGEGGYTVEECHSMPSCGYVTNGSIDYDTVLEQWLCEGVSPSLREGGTYLLTGWIKTVGVLPNELSPGGDPYPNGAFVQIVADSSAPGYEEIELVRTECLTGSNNWQKFSLWFSLPLDYFMDENDGLTTFDYFDIRCCLHYASGTAYFDDINITELEFTEDVATVVPQPQAIEYRGYHSDPLAGFLITNGGPYTTTIYYTPDALPHLLLGDTYEFSAENLRQELNRAFYECEGDDYDYDNTGWEGIKYDYPITEDKVVALDDTVTSLNKPCIVLGDPDRDLSVNHLFQAELEKRGIVLPEDFNPEGYIMDIGEDIILIAASDQDGAGLTKGAGSFYGTQTLLQLLDIEDKAGLKVPEEDFYRNTVVAPACYIYDFPDMEWRGQMTILGHWLEDSETDVYPGWRLYMETGFWADTDNNVIRNQKLFAKKMANFKMNRLSIGSGVFFFLEYDVLPPGGEQQVPYDKNYKYLESLFDYCRKLHIEPIPITGDYYFALMRHNGNCLEYMIYDSEYIDDNNLRPGQVDYYDPVPDQNTYPVPMPQPSWEFTIGRDPDKRYYFEEHEVNVWDEDVGVEGDYVLKSTLAYRVCYREEEDENVYPIRVEEKVDGDWVELVEEEDYELKNVGLNTTMYVGEDQIGTSYLRLKGGGFYGYEGEERAYITFTDLEPRLWRGTEVRVSYAAPIKWSYINTGWEELPEPYQLAYWTCMSYFDDDGDDDLFNDIPEVDEYEDLSDEGFDNPGAWTSWDSRDIWYVALYQMINRLKPRYIDIQHCEQFFMHTDDRCQVERKHGVRDDYCEDEQYPHRLLSKYHNAFILGKEIDWMRRAMEEINGEEGTDTRLMMFGDQFNSHNGTYFEGRCWWDWYDEEVDPYHQPDADDPVWEGDELSHVYYQPAMGGMGGWTWDSSEVKNPLLMASTYIEGKDDLVIAEWGYQSGIFDDREGFEYIEWRDKYELRYDELVDQGFTDFVGMCAGYAVIGGEWRRLRLKCKDNTEIDSYYCSPGLDGTNLNWVQLIGDNMSKDNQEEIDITLYLETSTHDAYEGCGHFDEFTGEGCHVGTVQDGVAYLDDVEVSGEGMSGTIDNPSFEFGLSGWTYAGPDYVTWECSDEESHGGYHSCKLEIDRTGYYYNTLHTHIRQDYYEALQTPTVNLNFSVYVKTIKLDALRHLNPKIWTDLTDEYYQEEEILGMMSTFWGHGNRTFSTEPTSADWMWSREYPPSPFIKYMHYDPYFLFNTYNFHDVVNEPYLDGPYPKDLEELSGE